MSRIAIDVVLLPETGVAGLAVEINRKLIGSDRNEIVLDETTCLPHLSLAMGVIESEQVDVIMETLAKATGDGPTGDLVLTGVVTVLNAKNEPNSMFAVAKTIALQKLHERVMEAVEPYISSDVTARMIYGDEDVAPSTLTWIRDYRQKAAFGAFFPHITIGYGVVQEAITFPIRFVAPRLALCHLGNHCTCRRVLASVAIPPQ